MNNHPLTKIRHLLPASINELLAVISPAGVVELVKHRGGTRLKVPKTLGDAGELAQWLEADDLRRLVAWANGAPLELPRCLKATLMARDLMILQDRRQGLTLTQLALNYRMTERGITKALRRAEKTELKPWAQPAAEWRQGDLFT